ncbi:MULTISPECIES: LysR family transcriptional regulator [Blastomonas]|nr:MULTISPECIES: LysR family transcriptional regulator [Blastomonas]AOG01037.1 bacterial regulatory helix-turn-helix, lysR family protein [Blastomonas sp. RAC04]
MTARSLNEIVIFMAVADAGSFARGGRTMGLTGSAASKAVARLEARLGVRLLHRNSRAVSLTSEGERFRESGRAILEAMDEAEASIAVPDGKPRGLLRLSVPDAFGRRVIMPLVSEYLERWPDVRIDIDFSDRPVDLVEEGFDLAIRIGGESAPDGIVSRVVAEYPVWICAAPSYLERRGHPPHVEALSGHDCILFRSRTRTQEWFDHPGGEHADKVLAHGRLRMNSAEAIRMAALSGLGIALLPAFLVDDDLSAGHLVRLFPELGVQTVRILCLYPSRRLVDPRVRTFIDNVSAALTRVT